MQHIPVLLPEAVRALEPRPGGWYLDGTLGLGGHARALLEAARGQAHLLGLDQDRQALALARERLAEFTDGPDARATLVHSRYADFERVLDEQGWPLLDGALLDIGVSSLQLDQAERGFSFAHDGPLDMRMDQSSGAAPAASLVNRASVDALATIFREYGEEPLAGRIARAIVDARASGPIESTAALAGIVARAYPAKWRATARNHPATRAFQALRIAVNRELEELERFLKAIPEHLKPGGRVAVITFHSLEDRIVKNVFRDAAKACICPPHLPECVCGHKPMLRVLTKKPITPTEEETALNPRAASSKLRVAERI